MRQWSQQTVWSCVAHPTITDTDEKSLDRDVVPDSDCYYHTSFILGFLFLHLYRQFLIFFHGAVQHVVALFHCCATCFFFLLSGLDSAAGVYTRTPARP